MKDNKQFIGVLIIVLTITAAGIGYVYLFSQPGIEFSCNNKDIIGFKRVPPPAMAVVQPTICKVSFEAKVGSELLCSGEKNPILNAERSVIACAKLNENLNKTIEIKATFFDANGDQILGQKNKNILYEGF
jgi:hypothetical protein